MNNLNITQNSNDLNESEKTQEKLYSNETSLDDILTYSDDLSQNPSINKPPANIDINSKQENNEINKGDIDLLNKNQLPMIHSFNSEVTLSFLNNQNDNNNNITKEYHSKSDSKSQSKNLDKDNKHLIKSSSDFKSISFTKSNIFDMLDLNGNNNLKDIKDISEIHNSISDILSKFEIKDISISRSINNNIKKNNSERKNHNLNKIINNENYLGIRSENLFNKNNIGKLKNNNQISNPLNINKEQISEDHSNTNSMCNYQNVSNLNEISNNKNLKQDNKKEKENSEIKKISKNNLSEFSIKLNMSLDNCSSKNEKSKFFDGIIDDSEINKKDNFTTSNKKENNFYYSNQNKIMKNSLKYTKAQCINSLIENNLFSNNENNKNILNNRQFCPSNPIKTRESPNDKTKELPNDKDNNNQIICKKIIFNLSPHKLSFEIQKNDCIQISINQNKKDGFNINNGKQSLNNEQSSLSINKEFDNTIENNFYNNKVLKKNNTTSFMIPPYYNSNISSINYQKRNLNKQVYINNKNVINQKTDSNNFFYNPKNKFNSLSSVSNKNSNSIKKRENDLHTPDLNKNKVTPMTCVHKGSLVYCNDHSQINNDNTIKINKINNGSNFIKKNNYSFTKNSRKNTNNSNFIKPKKSNNKEKKLVYLRNNINRNNLNNNCNIKKNLIQYKNNSFSKNNNSNYLIIINKNKNQNNAKVKIEGKEQCKNNPSNPLNNLNNSKAKQNLNIRNSLKSNNSSINSTNNRKNIFNKIKTTKHKNNTILDKINNDLIKESSLFSILYNNISQKATIKTNSRPSSNDKAEEREKESTIIHKEEKIEKIKKPAKKEKKSQKKLKNLLKLNTKNKAEKKLVKHNTNNSLSIYNSILEKALNESKKKIKIQNKNNDLKKNKYIKTNDDFYKIKKAENKQKEKIKNNENKKKGIHKKINTQIDLNALTSNFNFINEERRKNNKSLYNFGNIYFINQNQIIKNDLEGINPINNENNNGNYINLSIKKTNIKLKENNYFKRKKNLEQIENGNKNNEIINKNNKTNSLNVSNAKQSPKVIMNFSKYKKKGDFRKHLSIGGSENPILNGYNLYNKIEYKETQLISDI